MIIGEKPIQDMSEDELREAVAFLQSNREALRNEAVRQAKERADNPTLPRTPKARGPKAPSEKDKLAADMLLLLQGKIPGA